MTTPPASGPSAGDRPSHTRIARGTVRLTHADETYLRTGPGQLVTGTVLRGQRFEIHAVEGRWAWGTTGGRHAQRGWVNLGDPRRSLFSQVDRRPDDAAGRPRNTTEKFLPFVRGSDKREHGTPYTRRAKVINPDAKLYANVRPDGSPGQALPADFLKHPNVGIRYSPRPGWVVVFRGASKHETGHAQWALMRRSDLELQPDEKFRAWQRRVGVTDTDMFGRGPSRRG